MAIPIESWQEQQAWPSTLFLRLLWSSMVDPAIIHVYFFFLCLVSLTRDSPTCAPKTRHALEVSSKLQVNQELNTPSGQTTLTLQGFLHIRRQFRRRLGWCVSFRAHGSGNHVHTSAEDLRGFAKAVCLQSDVR